MASKSLSANFSSDATKNERIQVTFLYILSKCLVFLTGNILALIQFFFLAFVWLKTRFFDLGACISYGYSVEKDKFQNLDQLQDRVRTFCFSYGLKSNYYDLKDLEHGDFPFKTFFDEKSFDETVEKEEHKWICLFFFWIYLATIIQALLSYLRFKPIRHINLVHQIFSVFLIIACKLFFFGQYSNFGFSKIYETSFYDLRTEFNEFEVEDLKSQLDDETIDSENLNNLFQSVHEINNIKYFNQAFVAFYSFFCIYISIYLVFLLLKFTYDFIYSTIEHFSSKQKIPLPL